MPIAALDVDYRGDHAIAACVLFKRWTDSATMHAQTVRVAPVAPYESGEFYRRELPCLEAAINALRTGISTVVIDGYVTLADGKRGLGAYLFESLGRAVPVIGVAKSPFRGADALSLYRGESSRPLWIGAAGISKPTARGLIASMHGPYRLPTLLKQVDQLCRGRS